MLNVRFEMVFCGEGASVRDRTGQMSHSCKRLMRFIGRRRRSGRTARRAVVNDAMNNTRVVVSVIRSSKSLHTLTHTQALDR